MGTTAEVLPKASADDSTEVSFYERVGALLGLKPLPHTELDLVDRLERGLPAATVSALRAREVLSEEETYALIAPRRTLARRETLRQPLTADEGDRVVRVARVAARARTLFSGDPAYAAQWLRAPNAALGQRKPLQALSTAAGGLVVEELLSGAEHGMFG